ncbi:hypothetical protein ACFPPD_20370 [Cohnella suwonensis]|uniref:Uncharacterized protein n=1 Tax=Cohnella suwonensis TaxID=696072 RepID=A0ABW0LZ76_9BACL
MRPTDEINRELQEPSPKVAPGTSGNSFQAGSITADELNLALGAGLTPALGSSPRGNLGELSPEHFERQRILEEDDERRDIERKTHALWMTQEKSERRLRTGVAIGLGIFLGYELYVGNRAFLKIGEGAMVFPKWTVQIFFLGMYGQISTMAYFVVKSLFPRPKSDSLSAIREMVKNNYRDPNKGSNANKQRSRRNQG